ncbi:MAG: transposon-encoded TnpW family protein [Bacilli bacterium]|nr:transposon-encoded TnpW family protein [Bacilli bacterium]
MFYVRYPSNASKKDDCTTFKRTIDKTTDVVHVHFSQTSEETMVDKIERLLQKEVRQMCLFCKHDE